MAPELRNKFRWLCHHPEIADCQSGMWLPPVEGLGYDQTWQNLTGLRALDATYINNSPKPILVSMTAGAWLKSEWAMSLKVNGTRAAYCIGYEYEDICELSIVVPSNMSYGLYLDYGPSNAAIMNWAELR